MKPWTMNYELWTIYPRIPFEIGEFLDGRYKSRL